ncbi:MULTISPECIES: GTP 3',8-cyclase MoaA [unclassified Leptolyngbya]|uniref:GTP 3',8-cyclase MoaA n=1 Tax=unclassified Leptolyngbya TaxID=2650499 RepID=UPI001688BDAF|nr:MULTISPECIES: GTP 3',8-cyclase MoaA [unclassified Leptolyngbya]MBD1912993.1 GTP 3',8-cyclase MoaA [Leptolyngbya sp. FACHB-8]MBD2155696.1 GTP 3',8-cyclase MoaA [Leptolyngbya sp. FACHB-16]
MAIDRYGRSINYLRISLTDRCNLRCVYCMPETMTFRPRAELLQDEELQRLIPLFATILGFRKFRLTGGEPTLRENIVGLVRHIAAAPGVEELAMTTNGVLLSKLAQPLAEAGLQRVNISIDTLDPDKFKAVTRWGDVGDVWSGIKAATEVGLHVKLNAVIVRGFNDREDVIELARLTYDFPWQVRFIEMMPFGEVAEFQQANSVSEAELLARIGDTLDAPVLLNNGQLDGEARLYQLPGAVGSLGFISPVTQPFCAGCNRARLTADGRLRLCLLRDHELDVLTPLRQGISSTDLQQLIEDAIWLKPWGHGLAEEDVPLNRVMSEIGG